METKKSVQELKSERVQQELVAEEPFRIWLKSERVQEPALAASGGGGTAPFLYELAVNQRQAVSSIELRPLEAIIHFNQAQA